MFEMLASEIKTVRAIGRWPPSLTTIHTGRFVDEVLVILTFTTSPAADFILKSSPTQSSHFKFFIPLEKCDFLITDRVPKFFS